MIEGERVLDRYEVLETISTRARGSVRKAYDHRLGRMVALKTLFLTDARARDELVTEAKTLQLLDVHPGLPRLRNDFDLDDGSYVIVIDWVDGIDFEAKLGQDGHPGLLLSSVVDWIKQVAAALDHLHSQDPPIVHGDVKPSNIVLTHTNAVVLVDFGIAKKGGQTNDMGTPGYMAPEVAGNQPVTAATDVYGLAATAFTLLTGSPPGPGPDQWRGIDNSEIAALKLVLQRGLATDAARRFPTAGEFAKRLAAGASELYTGNVTLFAAEVADAQDLWESDEAVMATLLARVSELVHVAVDEAGGRVSGGEGGGERVVVGFSSASAALRAALEVRDRTAADWWMRDHHVGLRIALHNGEPEQRDGQYVGRAVAQVRRIREWAAPNQVLVSWTTAPLLMDRMPPGTRLVECPSFSNGGSTSAHGAVYSVETGEIPLCVEAPLPSSPLGPQVSTATSAPPPRRRASARMARLLDERNEVREALELEVRQQDEAQRAGQPGLAARFGERAEASAARLLELEREIERLEAEEGRASG